MKFAKMKTLNYTRKALLIGFTNRQTNDIFKIYQNYLKKANIELCLLKIDEYALCIKNGHPSIDVDKFDFCIQLVKDQYISTLFEKHKKPCFNDYQSMCLSDDKFLAYVKLAENDISLPKTISGNTDFDGLILPDYKRSNQFKDKIEKELKYPFVAKPTFGYGGKGVVIIRNREEFDNFIDGIGQAPYLYQEFIKDNPGTDIRVMVVGGKVIFSIMRQNPNSFISNVSSGGSAISFEATKEQKQIAVKVAKLLKLDCCAVDFFNTKKPLVCEVNANAGGIETNEKLTGINQVKKFVDFILNKVYKVKELI